MWESENEREIEVRSLNGESITVSIEPNKTVQDLKTILKNQFHPAASSPNFHLFLKGVKLKLQHEISSYAVGLGEFLVLFPFTKKDKQQTERMEESAGPSKEPNPNESSVNNLAESAWSELMQDLSALHDISSNENLPNVELNSTNVEDTHAEVTISRTKRKRVPNRDKKEGPLDDLLSSMLQKSSNEILDKQNCKVFIEVLESSCCLNDPRLGICVMREASDILDNETDPSTSNSSSCICPPWLKDIIMAFSFSNIYSAWLQFRQEKITISALQGALDQLHRFGFRPGITELENLSELCPQIIRIVNSEAGTAKLSNCIIITKTLTEESDLHESLLIQKGTKCLPRSKIFSLMKKREGCFKNILSEAVKSVKYKNGEEMVKSFLLEDLISVKKGDTSTIETEVKLVRRNYSSTSGIHSYEALCHDTNSLLAEEMIQHLKRGIGSQGQVVHIEEISARIGKYVEIPCMLSENIKAALKRAGITRLYSHQAESIQASLAGKNVVVATMTSSGKSLCYNVPVLEVLSHNPLASALYLFPTKALAQDQLRSLLVMTQGLDDSLNIGIYDGDTSQEDRLWLRDNARLLITNPDMLHVSILPFHGQFRRILSNLRYIIIDEAHSYKGAFGCHAALIFRRLRRLCFHVYGTDPSFIFSTATSANPREHAMELANLPTVELIENDGSPSGSKLFVLWNPPLCLKSVWKRIKTTIQPKKYFDKNVVTGRTSPILEVSYLFAEMIQHGLRCIAFCKTRKLSELVLSYTREVLQDAAPHLVNSIYAYRSGYIAENRRRIETDLFNGSISGIAATNALELGIDVGNIDVTLHLGFPGSIASLWQQAGRSGRREKPSLSIYVAFEGPLDQFFMKFPQKLFRGPIECCHIDAKNEQVLEQHLVCASLEHPLSMLHDKKYFGPGLESAILTLKTKGYLSTDLSRDFSARIWSYIGHEKRPSSAVSIRAIENVRYKVIDKIKDEVLEEIEESKAFFQVYEGAVYMNQGKTYLVKHLDLSSKIAWCHEADLKYYTKTRDYTDIHVIGGHIAYPVRITNDRLPRTTAQAHNCKVTTTWFGFRRIWRRSNQVFDTVELSLPDYSYESQAVWIRVPQSVKTTVETLSYSFRGGLHAAGHALLNIVPLYIICNPSDLASECINPHDARYVPERILLYDPHPGGTSISAKVQPIFTELLTAALELLTSCHCSGDTGCPNCVQNLACHEYNEVLHKDAAIMIIKGVLDAEQSNFKGTAEAS
ncbi:ATP-dependent helicase hrq1 isoform X1 [Olea europaea subsp. europaea]|uniref:ATP-dependent helicase hrq1 isoform X1 n=1 Tax=Olea europaea subsp. europaea TaxID=158383 RepID=A0A8S0RWM6_OLEEU|nr:ATP-dependent helicase hrq1 isoform X1 [Olea europaea subsp. europaea]